MIVHTGEALIDFIPVRDAGGKTAFQPAPGGSPYNTSIAAARLEVPVEFFGKVSRDFFGDQLLDNLVSNNVGTQFLSRDDAPSTLAFVKKSATGEARYAFFANGAADRLIRKEDLPELPEEVMALQAGSISIIADPAGAAIVNLMEREATNRVVSFDPNIRESVVTDEKAYRARLDRAIGASTIVKVSDEDLRWLFGVDDPAEAAPRLLEKGPLLVVVTEGAQGSTAYIGDLQVAVPAERTSVADTIGAGDSFHAAILAWLYHSGMLRRDLIASIGSSDLEAMLRFAGAVAAKTCGRAGADPPRLSEVQTRFRSW